MLELACRFQPTNRHNNEGKPFIAVHVLYNVYTRARGEVKSRDFRVRGRTSLNRLHINFQRKVISVIKYKTQLRSYPSSRVIKNASSPSSE